MQSYISKFSRNLPILTKNSLNSIEKMPFNSFDETKSSILVLSTKCTFCKTENLEKINSFKNGPFLGTLKYLQKGSSHRGYKLSVLLI